MAKTKISEFSSTAGNNTDIDSINIAEGCAPSGINNAIRELMAQLKDFQAGTAGDSFNGPVGTTTAAAGAFTTLTASSTATLNTLASSGATLTGGTINGMAIGGTTAAAVSATTLTTSSTVTINGGTANGVAYLNGSKVLTTGSALTFNGTNLGVGGVASVLGAAVSRTLSVSGGTGGVGLVLGNDTGTNSTNARIEMNGVTSGGNARQISFIESLQTSASAAGALVFGTHTGAGGVVLATEQMRLTSTGLGIGTSSPGTKLHVSGSFGSQFRLQETGGTYFDIAAGGRFDLKNAAGTTIVSIAQSGSPVGTQLNLDSSGNLGLGVTPSAWSAFKAFEIGSAGNSVWSAGANDIRLAANYVYNGGGTYAATGLASQYQQTVGQHRWYTAPSGTAGNAISFTQAMTLDASGNLLVGGTTNTSMATVQVSVGSTSTASSALQFLSTTSGSNGIYFGDGTSGADRYRGYLEYNHASDFMVFATATAERARIDSSGRLLVGTTSAEGAGGLTITPNGSAGAPFVVWNRADTASTTVAISFRNNGTAVGTVSYTNTATAYNTSSDYRLKNITGPITTSGAYIDSLNPVEGTWKADGSTFVGLIAHEVQEASRTQVATGVKDGEEMQGMDYSSAEIIANLIAEVKSLRQRLAAAGI